MQNLSVTTGINSHRQYWLYYASRPTGGYIFASSKIMVCYAVHFDCKTMQFLICDVNRWYWKLAPYWRHWRTSAINSHHVQIVFIHCSPITRIFAGAECWVSSANKLRRPSSPTEAILSLPRHAIAVHGQLLMAPSYRWRGYRFPMTSFLLGVPAAAGRSYTTGISDCKRWSDLRRVRRGGHEGVCDAADTPPRPTADSEGVAACCAQKWCARPPSCAHMWALETLFGLLCRAWRRTAWCSRHNSSPTSVTTRDRGNSAWRNQ